MMFRALLLTFILFLLIFCTRLWIVLPGRRQRQSKNTHSAFASASTSNTKPKNRKCKCKLAIFLGSGGHTNEALALLSTLDFERYSPRVYMISEGDHLSANKAIALENAKSSSSAPSSSSSSSITTYTILTIPRARQVHQSILTTPPTALLSLFKCIYYVTFAPLSSTTSTKKKKEESSTIFADALILNGPGTCFVLCVAVYINKILGLPAPKMFYIESFARVRKLSLSGKMLRYLVDRFIVQWPQLLDDGKRGEYHGWLV